MHQDPDLHLSATDLSNYLACRHLTTLDLEVARGGLPPPKHADPRLATLRERGLAHERAYFDHLRAEGLEVLELTPGAGIRAAVEETFQAIERGVEVIAQATLAHGRWLGRADLLRRVEGDSRLGAWCYEPYDTKLARETRAGAVLQLCVYAELLEQVQGARPEWLHVVPPGRGFAADSFRTAHLLAYARRLRRRLEERVTHPGAGDTFPTPTAYCEVCRWWRACDERRRADDHLCLVAGMRRSHERRLVAVGVETLTSFAGLRLPLPEELPVTSRPALEALRDQARVQLAGRLRQEPVIELRPGGPGQGLARLPEPSPGDVFLDLEGDPFVGEGGLEYLFGSVTLEDGEPVYCGRWATSRREERAAFEAFMDELLARWENHPGLHVYHFGHYEPSALKRLMGRYGSRDEALDRLLRGKRFVDLHRVVREGVRASVESYSIKELEAFYGFTRATPLQEASRALRQVEGALELGRLDDLTAALRQEVAGYNRDDCLSTLQLRGWLEGLRREGIADGAELPRPSLEAGEPSEQLNERLQRLRDLAGRLVAGLPDDPAERSAEQQAQWLLAHSLEFHRREDKVTFWELFRLAELPEDQRLEEPRAIAGLRHIERIPPRGRERNPIDVYSFPVQEVEERWKKMWIDPQRRLGTVVSLDLEAGRIDLKKAGASLDEHPSSSFFYEQYPKDVLVDSLERLAQWVAEHGIDGEGPHRAARDLLLRHLPRGCSQGGGGLRRPGEAALDAGCRLVGELDAGVLPIQGPPGAGKTHTAAHVIVDVVRRGGKVGITALSHKVIAKLLEEATKVARDTGVPLRCFQKQGKDDVEPAPTGVTKTTDNGAIRAALDRGDAQVAAGTAWLWARHELTGAVDVLFVDEAGQMALADVLALAQGARSLVLIGDPQQLEQPIQGTHPDGSAVAALAHLLGDHATLPADRGLFLEATWRLHPTIAAFTSEQFYEGRLASREGLDSQCLHAPPPFDRSGLFFLPVEHEGNQSSSEEEGRAVATLVAAWLDTGAEWTDASGVKRQLGLEDILVVTPYNAQIALLRQHLRAAARIGTVDKFQGQQAPVVIYSMATSTPEEAPRGLEFLYSRNRFNVATSRAQCACVLVASPRLLEPECRTPRQMQLANTLCRYVELAEEVGTLSHQR